MSTHTTEQIDALLDGIIAAMPRPMSSPVQAQPDKPDTGARLKYYRQKARLTSTDVQHLGVCAQSTVIQMEKGKCNPSPAMFVKLATAYGCSVEELTGDSPTYAAAMAIAGSTPVTRDYLEFIVEHLVRPLTERVTALEAQIVALTEAASVQAVYGDVAAMNVPYKPKSKYRTLTDEIYAVLGRSGRIDIDTLVSRIPGRERCEVESALCMISDELKDGWYIGCGEWIELESIPDETTSLRQVRQDAPADYRARVKRVTQFRQGRA